MRQDWLERIVDPAALVAHDGGVLRANRALRDLVASLGCARSLEAMFGRAAVECIDRAAEAPVQTVLALAFGPEPRPRFRLSVSSGAGGRDLLAVLADLREMACCRDLAADRDREMTTLRELGATLTGAHDFETLVERIHDQTVRVCAAQSLFLAVHDREKNVVSFPRYIEDGAWRTRESRPFSNGLTEHVLKTGQTLLLARDVDERARALGIEPVGRPSRSWLGVPIAVDGETIGVLAVQDYERPDRYDEHDAQVLTIIAVQAAAAIRSIELIASARRAYQDLATTQARLLEAERLRGIAETAGAMNHEINNPLAAIVGNAQLLRRRPHGLTEEGLAKVDAILEAAHRIESVTTKVATLIQATSITYPGDTSILDVRRSVASGDRIPPRSLFPTES